MASWFTLGLTLPAENGHADLVGESCLPSLFSPWNHFIAKISSPLPGFFPHAPNKWNNSLHLQNLHFWPFPIYLLHAALLLINLIYDPFLPLIDIIS